MGKILALQIDDSGAKILEKYLAKLPFEVQKAANDKALNVAGDLLKSRVMEEVPVSRRSFKTTRDRWSAAMTAKYKWSTTISRDLVIRAKRTNKRTKDPYALVGPRYPEGNIHNFVHPMEKDTRERWYWGKRPANHPKVTSKDNDYIKRAVDENRDQIAREFKKAMVSELRRRLKTR